MKMTISTVVFRVGMNDAERIQHGNHSVQPLRLYQLRDNGTKCCLNNSMVTYVYPTCDSASQKKPGEKCMNCSQSKSSMLFHTAFNQRL